MPGTWRWGRPWRGPNPPEVSGCPLECLQKLDEKTEIQRGKGPSEVTQPVAGLGLGTRSPASFRFRTVLTRNTMSCYEMAYRQNGPARQGGESGPWSLWSSSLRYSAILYLTRGKCLMLKHGLRNRYLPVGKQASELSALP